MNGVRSPGKAPSALRPWLSDVRKPLLDAANLIQSQYGEKDAIKVFELRCPSDGGDEFRLALTKRGIICTCRDCGHTVSLSTDTVDTAGLFRDCFHYPCAKCGGSSFSLVIGFEYPSAQTDGEPDSVDWDSEGADDESVCWLWLAGSCVACGHSQSIADIEGD